MFAGGFDLPDVAADLTRSPGPQRTLELFQRERRSRRFRRPFARARLLPFARHLVEGGLRYARPKVSVRLSGDFEVAPKRRRAENGHHYLFDGSVVYHFGRPSLRLGRPFRIVGGRRGTSAICTREPAGRDRHRVPRRGRVEVLARSGRSSGSGCAARASSRR